MHLAAGPVFEERREDLGRSPLIVAAWPPSQRTKGRIDGSVIMMMAIMVTSDSDNDGNGEMMA